MYTKKTYEELNQELLRNNNVTTREVIICNTHLLCTSQGVIYRKMKSGFWKIIENKSNHNKGYNVILINKKQYCRGKIILHAFKELTLSKKNINIHHINNDRLDCSLNNLFIQGDEIKQNEIKQINNNLQSI